MSTCPRKDLLSAYIDGELSSPWKERVAEHVQRCPACKKTCSVYTAVHTIMQDAADISAFDSAALYERIAIKRHEVMQKKAQGNHRFVIMAGRFFSSSVRIPTPAVAAALMLFVFAPLVFFFRSEHGTYVDIPDHTPFTPILPISLEKHAGGVGYGITSTEDVHGYTVSAKSVTANTKIFTVRDFACLYLDDKHLFEPVESTVDLSLSACLFPFSMEYQLLDVPSDIDVHVSIR